MTDVVDRDAERLALRRQLRAAARGGGSLTVIEGVAGLGKTTLVRLAVDEALEAGLAVLRATGSPLEVPVAFGIARQLLEPALAQLDEAQLERVLAGAAGRAAAVLDSDLHHVDALDPHSASNALYWLVANLAAARPLLIVVDDAHVADAGSLAFLHFLARRCADMPVAIVLAVRPVEHRTAGRALTALLAAADETVHLRPLGAGAVTELVAGALGDPQPEFVEACVSATGGNALLVSELLRTLGDRGVAPLAAGADVVRAVAPGGVRRRVEAVLAELGPEAGALARAVAVLGECELFEAAALAGLATAEAGRLAHELEVRGVFERARRLRFAHPLLANAVEETMTAAELSDLHLAAARLLDRPGSDPDRVASHLVAARPSGDEWAVSLLERAASVAGDRGDPFAASAYLERAIAEPPQSADLPRLLLALGRAARSAGDPQSAVAHFSRALAAPATRGEHYTIALELTWSQFGNDDLPGALDTLESAMALAETDAEKLAVDGLVVTLAPLELPRRPALMRVIERERERAEAGGGDPEIRATIGAASIIAAEPQDIGLRMIGDSASRLANDAEADHMHSLGWILSGLDAADRTGEALAITQRALATARPRGDRLQIVYYQSLGAYFLHRLGRLADAEAAAREVSTVLDEVSGSAIQSAVLLETLIDRGADAEVRELLATLPTDNSPQRAAAWDIVRARGAIADGRDTEAMALLLDAGRNLEALGMHHPNFCPWRRLAAPVAARLGRHDLAEELAADQLAIARRAGAPSALAVALGTRALVVRGPAGIEDMNAACELLAAGPYRRDHAEMLSELGGLLIEADRVDDAREPLRRAMAIANETGAHAITEAARRRLIETGARPRRPALTGIEALTPSELQVARLAAEGLKNREVAEALFVTTKTVERHLGRVYEKLGVGGRSALAAALGPPV